jgi:hypothetical protein
LTFILTYVELCDDLENNNNQDKYQIDARLEKEEEADDDDSFTADDDDDESSASCQQPTIELNVALVGKDFDQGIMAMLEGNNDHVNDDNDNNADETTKSSLNLLLLQNNTTEAAPEGISKNKKRMIQEIS